MKIYIHRLYKYFNIDIIFLILGITITMPILTISMSGRQISVFYVIFILSMIILFFDFFNSKFNFKLNKNSALFLVWLLLSLLSSLFGIMYFNSKVIWVNKIVSYIPKIIAYSLVLIFIASSKNKKNIIKLFLKGFLIGIIINIIWAFADGLIYYIFNFSISNEIFSDYMKNIATTRKGVSIIKGGTIRVGGLNYDPAHLGGLIPIIIGYSIIKKKHILLFLSIGSLIFSQSTTALVSSLIIIIINLKFVNYKINIKSIVKSTFILLGIMILLISSLYMNLNFLGIFSNNYKAFINRVTKVYINQFTTNTRFLYHRYIPNSLYFNNFKVLTGTGFGTASYPYVYNDKIRSIMELRQFPYDPESTYISYLFDTGILGFMIYILVLIRLFYYYYKYKVNIILLLSIESIILSGLFYHYTITAYQVFILIIASIYISVSSEKSEKLT